jgi:hypothetical protein
MYMLGVIASRVERSSVDTMPILYLITISVASMITARSGVPRAVRYLWPLAAWLAHAVTASALLMTLPLPVAEMSSAIGAVPFLLVSMRLSRSFVTQQ